MAKEPDSVVKSIQQEAGLLVVRLTGEIDMYRTPQVLEALEPRMQPCPQRVIVDLSEVSYMDSSGVGTLVHLFRRINSHNGKLILVNPNQRVRSIFEITRLDRFFTICHDHQEALQA
jgi:anti-sigma B factor antagonist